MTYYEVLPDGPDTAAAAPDPGPPVAASDEIPAAEAPEPGVAERLAELTAALVAMQEQMRAGDDRAASRERIIDRLHEDNQKLRAGERRLVLTPALTDLQRLRNDLLRQAATMPADMDAARLAGLLDSYAHSVELTLERCGVVSIRPAPGDVFDGSRHRPSDVVEAPEPAADGRVAAVLTDGYEDTTTGRTLSPATVRVYRWTEPTTATRTEETHG
jgi:hypothetical protein